MTRNYDGTSSVPQPKGQYVKSLTGENIYKLEEYGGHKFNRYWFDFDTQTLYLLTRGRYKIIKPLLKNSFLSISLTDINDKIHAVSYNKFIKEFNEMVTNEKIK